MENIDTAGLTELLKTVTQKTDSDVTLAIVVIGTILLLAVGLFASVYLRA